MPRAMLCLECTGHSVYRFFVFPEGSQTRVTVERHGGAQYGGENEHVTRDVVVEVSITPEEIVEVLIMAGHLLRYMVNRPIRNPAEEGLTAFAEAVKRVAYGERLDQRDLVCVPSNNE
jgi:hypothetical protein